MKEDPTAPSAGTADRQTPAADGAFLERTRRTPPTPEAEARVLAIRAAVDEVKANGGVAGLRAALQHLAQIQELPTLCAGVHEVLGEMFPARNLSVVALDNSGVGLDYAYHVDEMEAAPPIDPRARSLLQYVMRSNRSLLATPDVWNELVAGGEVDPIDSPLAAWLGAPLSDGALAFGALVVKAYPNAPSLGARELGLLEVAARHVATAILRQHTVLDLQESEERFRALAENAPCAIVILQGSKVRFANEVTRELTGYSSEHFELLTLSDVVHPDYRDEVRRRTADLDRSAAPSRFEVKLVRKDGQARWVDISVCVLTFRGRPAIMGVGLDITERKAADARIEALAYRDALTDLANRRLLQDRLGVAIAHAHRSGTRLGVLFLDLDDFKDVNDSLGHHAGDELLKAIARRLTKAMRSDDTVARIGGDEFVVLLTHIADATQAVHVGQKILGLVKAPITVGERELFVNASVGISMYPEDGLDSDALLKNADAALYRAKAEGRDNCQLYTLTLHTAAMARLELEGGLRRALERDELFLEYQPALDLAGDRVHGVEALMRWNHPVHGVLAPGAFLPLAESSSLIVPMGWWALTTACRQVKAWQRLGHPDLSVAVNIAARQFHDPSLLRRVEAVLAETGLRPACLELEITETQAMQNPELTQRVLGELSAIGVRVSIDDFGTGYSSLSYLQRLPIHSLKVDRSFVQGLTRTPGDAAISTAIIRLAHTLDLTVQAEGVETREQLDILCQQGCERIQGFFYSRPLGVAACEAFLLQHRKLSAEAVEQDTLLAELAARSAPSAQSASARRSIVAIEDSDEEREALQLILTEAGYRVASTCDPRLALELVRQHQPDLVLCDIAMPELDGFGVVRALQADATTARFPVVFLTGRNEETDRVRAFRFGVVDYLTKPIAPRALVEKVAQLLSTLDRREGATVARGGESAQRLVEEVQRASRTGLLTVRGDHARARILLRAGTVVDQTGEVLSPIRAHFEELDPRQEHIIAGDRSARILAGPIPTFENIPPELREVIIADDNPLLRGLLRSVLEARAFLVHDTASGEEALRMALRRPPLIALLDVHMKGLDGFEVRRRLRAHRATRGLPVLLLSGCRAFDDPPNKGAGVDGSPAGSSLVHEILSRMELLMARYSQSRAAGAGAAGMRGALDSIGAPGLLQICHLGRLTGVLAATHATRRIRMAFHTGALQAASSDDAQGREAVFQFLAWTEGRYSFLHGATAEGGVISEPTDVLILEGCRMLDERSASTLEDWPHRSAGAMAGETARESRP